MRVCMTWLGCLALLWGCNKTPVEPSGPIAGSETHWLKACDTTAECGAEDACVCGICTRPCQANTCAALGDDAVCVPAESDAATALCGALPAEATGICAAACAGPADCAAGYACEAGVCVPAGADDVEPARISQRTTAPGPQQIDLLLVIDNSGSMCQEQAALSEAFASLGERLQDMDYRIAVTTTDLREPEPGQFRATPASPMANLNCEDSNGDPLVPDTADCAAFLAERADPALIRASDVTDQAMLAQWTRCLTTLGTEGDGFEGGLGATLAALSCTGPNAARFAACCRPDDTFDPTCSQEGIAPDFLRPDAQLAVLYLTDENDCTARNTAPEGWYPICDLAEEDLALGVLEAYEGHCGPDVDARACYARDCGELDPVDCRVRCRVSRLDNSNCEWDRDTLLDVDRVEAQLKSLKRDASDLLIWAIVGPEILTPDGDPVRYNRGAPTMMCETPGPEDYAACCPDGQCVGQVNLSCESDQGAAFSGYRYAALAATSPFGCNPETGCSICADTLQLDPAIERLEAARHAACLFARPACLVGGDLRPCATPEERAESRNYALRVTIDDAPLGVDGWRLTAEPGCPSGLLFELTDPDAVGDGVVRLLYSR